MQRYNFDRYRYGKLMAEGIAVHADGWEEAHTKAARLIPDRTTDQIKFTDNQPCPAMVRCSICHA